MEHSDHIKTIPPQWLKKCLPLILVVATAIIIYLLMATRTVPPTKQQDEKAWSVSAEKVVRGSIKPQLELLGSVESPYTTQLSAAVNANVLSVPVREGDYVVKGQPLVELEDIEAQLNFQQKKANMQELEASIIAENNRYKADLAALKNEKSLLDIALRSVERQKKLAKSNLTSEALIDNASNQYEQQALSVISRELNVSDHDSRMKQLKAKLLRAEADLASAELDVSRTKVNAPYDGQITRVNVSPGDRVRLGEPIVKLYDSKHIEVRAQIPDRAINLIRKALAADTPLNASANIYGQKLDFRLDRLSGRANSGAGGIDGLFESTDEKQPMTIGNSIKLVLDLPALEEAVTAPISAVYGTDRIYIVREDRLVSIKASIIGSFFDDAGKQRLILDAPLANNDLLITTQLPNAIHGLKVTVKGASL